MTTYIVSFSISEEIRVEADHSDDAVHRVREALRANTYPFNERIFIHAKAVDEIGWLP